MKKQQQVHIPKPSDALGDSTRKFLGIPEAQAIYGGSLAWWRKAVWLKQLAYYKRGDRVVFLRADLDDYFASRRVEAA